MKIYKVEGLANKLALCVILNEMGHYSIEIIDKIMSCTNKHVFVYTNIGKIINIDTYNALSDIEKQISYYEYPDTEIIPFDETQFKEDIGWNERDKQNANRIEEMLCNEVRAWSRDWSNYDKLDRKMNQPMSVTEFSRMLGEKYQLTFKPKTK